VAGRVGSIPYSVVARGEDAIRGRIKDLRGAGYRYAILDATDDAHLLSAGLACLDLPLTTGGAGLGMGIARALVAAGRLSNRKQGAARMLGAEGPSAILSGSCSGATLAQVAAVVQAYPSLKLDPIRLAQDPHALDAAIAWCTENLGPNPILVYASAPPDEVAEVGRRVGKERAAELVENAFRVLARRLADAGVRRFVVAGGETAGAVVEALGVRALSIGPEIAPGVPWTATIENPVFSLALKSGNFGGPRFFMDAFDVLG
jgi:uncharacterized protein YgbK (DUF1537 family)